MNEFLIEIIREKMGQKAWQIELTEDGVVYFKSVVNEPELVTNLNNWMRQNVPIANLAAMNFKRIEWKALTWQNENIQGLTASDLEKSKTLEKQSGWFGNALRLHASLWWRGARERMASLIASFAKFVRPS